MTMIYKLVYESTGDVLHEGSHNEIVKVFKIMSKVVLARKLIIEEHEHHSFKLNAKLRMRLINRFVSDYVDHNDCRSTLYENAQDIAYDMHDFELYEHVQELSDLYDSDCPLNNKAKQAFEDYVINKMVLSG